LGRLKRKCFLSLLSVISSAFVLLSYVFPSPTVYLPELSRDQRRAIRFLRETVAQVEEHYVTNPNLTKAFGAGLIGMQKIFGRKRFEVVRIDSGHYTLRAGGEEVDLQFGGKGMNGLPSMELAYRFALTKAGKRFGKKATELQVMYAVLAAILNSMDKFSSFLSPDIYREMQVETTGRYGGLGITITTRDKKITIVSPIEDTPADKAGLRPGDVISMVNGESTEGWLLSTAVKKMRGPPGTAVRIGILRPEWSSPREFIVVRAIVQIRSVKSRIMAGNIGYIRLTAFHERTSAEMGRAIARFRDAGVRSLILDLRNNPGGLLRQSVRVAEQFLAKKNMVVFTRGRHRNQSMYFQTHGNGLWAKKSLIVLINEGSASASEIVAGAVKDLGRGLLIGRKTFGKGSVQTIIPISGGAGIRITTAKYYTPLGIGIHGKGIKPDVEAGPVPKQIKKNWVSRLKNAKSSPNSKRKTPRRLPGRLSSPNFGKDDEALQVALRTSRISKSRFVKVLRKVASRVQFQMAQEAKRVSTAKVPGGRRLP